MGLVAVWWEMCRFITQGLGCPRSWWERPLGGELQEACVLQIACSSPEAARRDGVPLLPFQTLFCFFLSFLPTCVKQQTPPQIFAGYLQMGCSVCVVINLGFFSWSLYWQSCIVLLSLLVFVLAKLYCIAFSFGRMLKFLCLLWFLQRGFSYSLSGWLLETSLWFCRTWWYSSRL